jgi:hypothetical protein
LCLLPEHITRMPIAHLLSAPVTFAILSVRGCIDRVH